MSNPTSRGSSPTTHRSSLVRDGVVTGTADVSADAKSQRRIVSDSSTSRSGTCEDALDVEDRKSKVANSLLSDVSRGAAVDGDGSKQQGMKRITDSTADSMSLDGLINELGTGFAGGNSPTLSPGSSRAQSPGATAILSTTMTSPMSDLGNTRRATDGPNPLFSLSQLSSVNSAAQRDTNNTSTPAPFFAAGLVQSNNKSSPTPSVSGSKFTPLKRVKKGAASVKNSEPSTPAGVHTHTKRPSITSGTTEVASTSPGAIDAADYGIHGKKLATMFSNPSVNTPPSNNVDGTTNSPDLVLLHISLIIPPNSSPAYARHQRKMLRRKMLDDENSMLSVSDVGYSDDDAINDVDSDDLEPGPLSMLSPVVYQRGILIPHPRGDYVLLQREVGKTLGLPFVNGEDGENVATDEFGGVQGKGWQMRVYARNGWLTMGAWERAWREMERVDVEILETERKVKKPKEKKIKTKQIQGTSAKAGQDDRNLREGFAGITGDASRFASTATDSGNMSVALDSEDVYSDPGESVDEGPNGHMEIDDGLGVLSDDDGTSSGAGKKSNNNLDGSDIEELVGDDPFLGPSHMGLSTTRAPLQLENGTIGDGELEEAYRAHGEQLDDHLIDEDYSNEPTDLQDIPPSPTQSAKETCSPTQSRPASPGEKEGKGKDPAIGTSQKRRVHPYQYILDLLKPIVLTGLVVTGAMYFYGPTHKRGGRYGSWNIRNTKQMHIDEENFDMDQDVQDHCAGYARDAEMWRSWRDTHKDGGSSSGMRKSVHGDWTVTVTQTVTQRIVNAGATQIVVEIPSGGAQFPLGPLGLSEREGKEKEPEELPAETATDVAASIPTANAEAADGSVDAEVAIGGAPVEEDGTSNLDTPESAEKGAGEGEAVEAIPEPETVVTEEPPTNSKWFGKIGKIF